MRDLYSLLFHYHPVFFRFHHWHAWELLFSALYVPEFMHSWQHGQTHDRLCAVEGSITPCKSRPDLSNPNQKQRSFRVILLMASKQVLQELDFKTSSIQPHMYQQYSKRHCFNDSVRMWVWNKHCGSKSTFHVIVQPLEELYSFAYMHNIL